jgi:hypothetical protein
MKNKNLLLAVLSLTLMGTVKADELTQIQSAANKVRLERANRLVSIYQQALSSTGIDAEIVNEAKNEKAEVLFNQESSLDPSYRGVRNLLAPVFKSDSSRIIAVNLMNQLLTTMSKDLKAKVFTSDRKAIIVNEVVVGMGPQSAAYLQQKTSSAPNEQILVIDSAIKPGGTFANVNSAFALNSTNRKYDGERATPGSGDLNNVHDIVGLPDFKGKRWTEAGGLADVASAGIYLSNAQPLMGVEVVKVYPYEGNPSLYSVVIRDRATGVESNIVTNKVIFTSGLGEAKPFAEKASQELINEVQRDAKRARKIPAIESFSDFVERIGNPDNRKPLRDLSGKDILLVGRGDSGRVLAEFLTGLAPEEAYKSDVAQTGRPKRIFWFVGLEGERRCSEYIAETRARYAQIAQAINSGVLIPVPGRVTKIDRAQENKYSIDYTFRAENGTDVSKSKEIDFLLPKDERVGRTGETRVVQDISFDKVILTTGFDNKIPSVLEPVSKGLEFKDAWDLKEVEVKQFNNEKVAIAREHKNAPGIFLAGPANESLGGLPKAAELAGVNANTVSLFANVERTKDLARQESTIKSATPNLNEFTAEMRIPKKEVQMSRDANSTLIEFTPADNTNVKRANNVDLSLRTAIDFTFRRLKISGLEGALQVKIYQKEGSTGVFNLEIVETNLTAETTKEISKALQDNKLLEDVLKKDIFQDKGKVKQIDIEIPIMKDGNLNFKEMTTTLRRAKR